LGRGYPAGYDADLKGYFDSIPHDKLQACRRLRIADRQVLKMIRRGLETPVVEAPEEKGGAPQVSRPQPGTPQGGVISPRRANRYWHGFDPGFPGPQGPARWAQAKRVRYADDFVGWAAPRFVGPKLMGYVEAKLEGWMGLKINREKTRGVNRKEKKASLDFLGYTFRYDRDRHGRAQRYGNGIPTKKALQRERDQLRAMTDTAQSHKPRPRRMAELNRHRKGWGNDFSLGYPRSAYGRINSYVQQRLYSHLRRRSQRPFRPPEGVSFNQQFARLGLRLLSLPRP